MKRKRGHKKHKKSHHHTVADDDDDDDDDGTNNIEDQDSENTELDNSDTEIEVPVKVQVPIHSDVFTDKPGRVKVKLKSSKKLEHQPVHSDAQTQSDTDKSGSYVSIEKQDEGVRGGLELLSDVQATVSGNSLKKGGGIKIKSSRVLGTSGVGVQIMQTSGGSLQERGDRIAETMSDIRKIVGVSHQKEHKVSRYNEEELATSLGVIKKIMKMDAAEPFNAPVDPIALGIPDYLDIIDTPMDFGTICSNIELGHMYKNSEDVYNDVQYIWENCYKYNNKGDYIVDLMKRVKKNFMKYWTAAGLYSNQANKNIASEGNPVGIMAPSDQEKVHAKGTSSKFKKKGGRHGFNKHKSDCLCAVCVVRRRRKEREADAKLVETQIEISDGNVSQEFKQEEPYTENHYSEDASSNLDRSDADVDMEDQNEETPVKVGNPRNEIKEEVIEIRKTRENQQFQIDYESGKSEMEESPVTSQKQNSKYDTPPIRKEEDAVEILKSQLKPDSRIPQQQNMMCKNLRIDENPVIMKLCGALFSSNPKSIWSGPHSLVRQNLPVRKKSYGIHAALEMLRK
ncbi:hypothetical protein ACHQM5_022288 [Ranunculus cassubicifolius]